MRDPARAVLLLLALAIAAGGIALVAVGLRAAARSRRASDAPGTRRCHSCGYDMGGIPSDTCPECGWTAPRGWWRNPLAFVRAALRPADSALTAGVLMILLAGLLVLVAAA